MASRMERYYRANNKGDSTVSKRTSKNKDLYENIYEEVEYSNIEAVASIDKTNEIDINKIKEMLRRHENEDDKPIVKRQIPFVIEDEVDDKNYDINEILIKAKENKIDKADVIRSLENIDLSEKPRSKPFNNNEVDEDTLKELIHTITKTSYMNKKEDDQALTLLGDLKGDNTITTDNESIRKIIAAQKDALGKKSSKTEVIDKSFYTSGISFGSEDFESLNKDENENNNVFLKVLTFIVLVALTAGIILGLIMFLR